MQSEFQKPQKGVGDSKAKHPRRDVQRLDSAAVHQSLALNLEFTHDRTHGHSPVRLCTVIYFIHYIIKPKESKTELHVVCPKESKTV